MICTKHLNIITQKQLLGLIPLTAQHILRMEKAGLFPKRIKLGKTKVGWFLFEIEEWIKKRR